MNTRFTYSLSNIRILIRILIYIYIVYTYSLSRTVAPGQIVSAALAPLGARVSLLELGLPKISHCGP